MRQSSLRLIKVFRTTKQCGLQYLILSYGAKTISQERLTSLTGIERLT
jgi:hypothetical protein